MEEINMQTSKFMTLIYLGFQYFEFTRRAHYIRFLRFYAILLYD